MASHVLHLESPVDGTRLSHAEPRTTHAGRPLLVRYDLERIGREAAREEVAARPASMWRWRELLPLDDPERAPSLGEAETPLLPCPRLGAALGLERLLVKDESRLPTGSFKARGLAVAVARARELGLSRLAVPTAGNAGAALAAYAARAGLEAWVLAPADTPAANRAELALLGARAFLVDGLITDCAAAVAAGTERMGWFDVSTLKEPYRLEGKKTMGLELALQLGWRLPDAIVYPTGGGTGLVGMWKAFDELERLGWIEAGRRPRMFACQAAGCDPIVRAFERGERSAAPVTDARTVASGLRVPRAVGDFLILDAVRDSGGAARRATDEELLAWARRGSALEGISFCPETGACLAALAALVRDGVVGRDEQVVVFNTGAGQKYADVTGAELPRLPPVEEIDWDGLAASGARS